MCVMFSSSFANVKTIFIMQNIIDIGVTKIERSENSIHLKNADMESKISEGVQIIKTVQSNVNTFEEKIMNVTRVSLQVIYIKVYVALQGL